MCARLPAVLELRPTEADVDRWRDLAARALAPNPFFEPELVLPAVRHLEGGDGVRLLVAERRGEWVAAAPAVRLRRWHGIPTLAHGTWEHPYCFFGAPLAADTEAAASLFEGMRRRAAVVPLPALPDDGPLPPGAVVYNRWERAALRRRPADDYVETTLASKRRREYRRLRTRFEAEQGAPMAFAVTDGGPEAVERFLALEAAGWKGRAGTAMRAVSHGEFFRETCAAFAAADRLQLVELSGGERTLAMQCNLRVTDGVFCFKLAVNEDYARYSPGVQLQVDNVHLFHGDATLQWEDSCADPSNQMINRLWPDRRRLVSAIVPGTGALGRAGRLQARAAVALRNRRQEELHA